MITDRENTVSIQQAVTATAVSTDSILISNRDLGRGHPHRFYVDCDEAVTAAGAATVTFELVQADNTALSTNVEVLATSPAIGKAALLAGTRPFEGIVPRTSRAHLGIRYTVGTGPLTAGKFTGGIVPVTDSPIADRPIGYTGLA
jgi:hypothetical protein